MTWSTYCSIEKFDVQQLLDGKTQQQLNQWNFLTQRNWKSLFDTFLSSILDFIGENGLSFK